jgi:crotonobetainyl-CoA:carnitine CoA-transferase CaiB-like acyl-CoA transferase
VARHGYEYVAAPGYGSAPNPRAAFLLSDTPVPIDTPAPAFGQDNHDIFGNLLGLDAAALDALEGNAIIASEPPAVAHH